MELKRRYLKSFTALADDQIIPRLKAMNHQRIVDETLRQFVGTVGDQALDIVVQLALPLFQ